MPHDTSPWMNGTEAGAYVGGRSKRYLRREVKLGRLRAAIIGGRKELLFRREWLDQYLEDLATPVVVNYRRTAGR